MAPHAPYTKRMRCDIYGIYNVSLLGKSPYTKA